MYNFVRLLTLQMEQKKKKNVNTSNKNVRVLKKKVSSNKVSQKREKIFLEKKIPKEKSFL